MTSALETFRQYTEAFRALDAHEVSRFFHAPALMLSPRGDFAFHTGQDAEQTYARVMEDARRQGYARTVFDQLDEHPFGEGLATIRGAGHWEDAKGEILSRFQISYVLRLENDAWKITFASIRPS